MIKIVNICVLFFVGFGIYDINAQDEKTSICREQKIGGIEFKFCINKEILDRDETCKLLFIAKIPRKRDIFVTNGDIWSEFIKEKKMMIFYLGGSDVSGDYFPQFIDLKKFQKTKYNQYTDSMSLRIADIENQYKINITGPIILRFIVSFAKKIKEPLKTILLTESWPHWRDYQEKWYSDCYASFFENFISYEEIGSMKIEIKDHDCPK